MPFQPTQCPGQEILCYTVSGFLFEKLIFVCDSRKVLFSNRPVFENKQICNVKDKGVFRLQVCVSSVLPCSPAHSEPVPRGDIMRQEKNDIGPLGWTLGTFRDSWWLCCATLAHMLRAALPRVTMPHGWQPLGCFCGLSWSPESGVSWDRSCCRKELLKRCCGVLGCVCFLLEQTCQQ